MPNPRKPKARKLVEGTHRKDRDPKTLELPAASDLKAPDWLCCPEAVDAWQKFTSQLSAARVLADADLTALAHLCNLHGRCVQMWRAGLQPKAAELTQLRLFFKEFHLTPHSRQAEGGADDGADEDPAEEFFGPRAVND